jgi:hypothetical protein
MEDSIPNCPFDENFNIWSLILMYVERPDEFYLQMTGLSRRSRRTLKKKMDNFLDLIKGKQKVIEGEEFLRKRTRSLRNDPINKIPLYLFRFQFDISNKTGIRRFKNLLKFRKECRQLKGDHSVDQFGINYKLLCQNFI